MKRIELYKKSCDILFNAYFNDTLKHYDCSKCAVGNLLSEVANKLGIPTRRWANVFCTFTKEFTYSKNQVLAGTDEIVGVSLFGNTNILPIDCAEKRNAKKEGLLLIKHSEYSMRELMKIEYAFEAVERGNSDEDFMFNGLVGVLNVLKEIHEIGEESDSQLERFTNHYKNRLLTQKI